MREVDVGARVRRRTWIAAYGGASIAALTLGLPVRANGAAPARSVLVLGDSLSAEYGLPRGTGWVALMQQRAERERVPLKLINASISGDTTSGGRSRLVSLMKQHRPHVLIIELGGNDALRGLPLSMTESNLLEMARVGKAAGAKVLIVGMQVPPNYGSRYAKEFAALFAQVAKIEGAALVPFLLHKVADGPDADAMFQADRIHPKAEAHPRIVDNVWPVLLPLLRT